MGRNGALAGFQPGDRVQYAYLGTAGVVVGLDEGVGRVLVELESIGQQPLRVSIAPALLIRTQQGRAA